MLSVERDGAGNAIFRPFRRPGEGKEFDCQSPVYVAKFVDKLLATDAKLIGELDSTYVSATNKDSFTPDEPKPEKLVITTANADYLPRINLRLQVVSFCEDGRWGMEDWGQWPQWLFDGQEHFAYILRKPSAAELETHPLRRLWWDMTEAHFKETGPNVGLLLPNIAQELYDIRCALMKEVNACVLRDGIVWQQLNDSASKMRSCTASLRFTPQEFLSVMLTVTAAQRYCLTTRALLDKINKWDRIPLSDDPRPVDNTIMGCVTDRIPEVYHLFDKGVPVWYVRPVTQLPKDLNIVEQRAVTRPDELGILTKRWKGAPTFYKGPLSFDIHMSIHNWKPGTLDIRLLGGPPPPGSGDHSQDSIGKRTEPYSKPQALARVATKKQISVNQALFEDFDSPYMTKSLGVWKDALAAVDVDLSRIIDHPNLHVFRGFAFPPPRLFCSQKEEISLNMMLAWLVICASWMTTFSQERNTPLPNPQQWRDYLRDVAMELELTGPDTRRSVSSCSTATQIKKQSRHAKSREAAKNIFTIYVPSRAALQHIIWHDQIVWHRNGLDFPPFLRRLLVWDSQEHNFRLELTTLDHCVLAGVWASPAGAVVRQQKLDAMWQNGFVLVDELPTEPSGIAARDWAERIRFVEAFCRIIIDWPGEVPKELSRLISHKQVNDVAVQEASLMERGERLAVKHYCQTFFDYFGRAPSVPHVLPDT